LYKTFLFQQNCCNYIYIIITTIIVNTITHKFYQMERMLLGT